MSTVQLLETGRKATRFRTCLKLAVALGISITDLLSGSPRVGLTVPVHRQPSKSIGQQEWLDANPLLVERRRRRLTQGQAATEIGVSKATVFHWEHGLHRPRDWGVLDRWFGRGAAEFWRAWEAKKPQPVPTDLIPKGKGGRRRKLDNH